MSTSTTTKSAKKTAAHTEENVAAVSIALTDDEFAALDRAGKAEANKLAKAG